MEAAVIDKISALNESIAGHVADETTGQALYLPPGATLAAAEKFALAPRFHRHHYETERLPDFVAYVTNNALLAAMHVPTVYVRANGSGARALFDHGEPTAPQWGHHDALLNLREATAWAAAQRMASGVHDQRRVIDCLEDWPTHITAHQGNGDDIPHAKAIATLRRVSLEAKASSTTEENDMARQRTTLESIEARGADDTLPAYFVVHSPIYVGTCTLDIVLRLSVRAAEKAPALALRIVGQESLAEETAQWVEATLREQLAGKVAGVYVGDLTIAAGR